MDTIVAIATSPNKSAGINIVRISGDDSASIAKKIFFSKNINGQMVPSTMYLGTIKAKLFSEKAFCVYFKAPKSYTGEDVIEIHCHGGLGVANAIVRLVREHGARPALAGEFTKRAFLNDKLTLVEAEGILEMINASSEAEINNAYRLMSGEVSKEISRIENLLIETIAMLEAKLDYPEELEEDTKVLARENLVKISKELSKHEQSAKNAKILKDGVNIAIVGVPNAGKSSLLNTLIKEDRAIVTDIAGTTRDVIEESIQVNGIKLNFLDTAGIREGQNTIEVMGIERSKNAIKSADIVIFVKDLSEGCEIEEAKIEELLKGKKVIEVGNKSDIKKKEKKGIEVSVKENLNVEKILDKIMEEVNTNSIFSTVVITNERQLYALQSCLNNVEYALRQYEIAPTECLLVILHEAVNSLAKITGREVSESIVDEVFASFCVGK